MSADALSQEEIDALLKGTGGGGSAPRAATASVQISSNASLGVAQYGQMMATTLGEMVGTFLASKAKFTPQKAVPQTTESAATAVTGKIVLVTYSHQGALTGPAAIIFKQEDACKIGGTMVGDPAAAEFGDMVADAFKEVINTVLGNLDTALGKPAKGSVSNTPAELEPVEAGLDTLSTAVGGADQLVLIPATMEVGDAIQSRCWIVTSIPLANSLAVMVSPPPAPAAPAPAPAAPAAGPRMKASPVEFDSLVEEAPTLQIPSNLELIMDIALDIRVELGRSHMKIKDVLKLGSGSVVELDKLAGEPVDLLVNDVIFAKGEVVVIDENFGVRITDILSLEERVKTLGDRKD